MAVTYDSVFRVPQAEIRVLQVIGEGTFGEVVLAYNSVFGRVAVKWLKVQISSPYQKLFTPDSRSFGAEIRSACLSSERQSL